MKTEEKDIKDEVNRILSNIKELRLSKNIGQEWMSEQIGITQAAYSNWEKGVRDLTYKNLLKIAKALDCNVIDIITYPDVYLQDADRKDAEKVSVTFEVSPYKRDYLLRLVMGENIKQ